ncbi:MAG TPA: hypothetical protein VM734_16955 [Kofleriaceae bacterium]|nr:hypothetical protein [Kofleriaceae bacterium]
MSRPPVDAVLQAGDTETLYRRAGDGPAVLLLCTGVLADPLGGWLFERLAPHVRVIAPTLSGAGDPADVLVEWLDGVTEGLGLIRPSVVIDEALAPALLDGSAAAPDAFAGVVVAVAADGTVAANEARWAGRGVLVVAVEGRDADALAAAMIPFLVGQGEPA